MSERMLVFEPGERLATMTTDGAVRTFTIGKDGLLIGDLRGGENPALPAPEGVIEDVEASVRAILTDVVADRLVETVVQSVKSHLDEHARIVDARYRTSPGTARLVDINFEPPEGSLFDWASKHPAGTTAVRLPVGAVRLIFEGEGGDRTSTTLAAHRETGRVSDE